jgi:uncharacterized membrane protein YphA (DoxX/SURF4 family)
VGDIGAAAIGAVLLTAGLLKVSRRPTTIQVWTTHEVFPPRTVPFLVWVIATLEIVLGVGILIPSIRQTSALAASLLFLCFCGYLAMAMSKGVMTGCGCFGFDNVKISRIHIVRAFLLSVLAAATAAHKSELTPLGIFTGVALASSFVLATSIIASVSVARQEYVGGRS